MVAIADEGERLNLGGKVTVLERRVNALAQQVELLIRHSEHVNDILRNVEKVLTDLNKRT